MKGGIGIPRSISRGYAKLKVANGKSGFAPESEEEKDNYVSKMAKYIPGEIVAGYLFADGWLRGTPNMGIYWLVFVVCAIGAPVYVLLAVLKERGRYYLRHSAPDIFHAIFSPFAVFVWVLALGGPFVSFAWYSPLLGPTVLVLFTIIIPAVDGLIAELWPPPTHIPSKPQSKPRK